MTLKIEFLGNLLAFVEVHAKPHACGECQWFTVGPRCRLFGRIQWVGEGMARRHLECVGKAFENDAPPAWPAEISIPGSPYEPKGRGE